MSFLQAAVALMVLLGFTSAFIGLFFGWVVAAALFVLGLLAMIAYQLKHMNRLLCWLDGPLNGPLPTGMGIWDYIFAGLHRRVRIREEERQALADAVDRFRQAGEALPDGVVILADHDQIEGMNVKAAQHLGLNPETDRGQTISNLVRDPEFVIYLEKRGFDEPLLFKSSRVSGQTLMLQIIPYGDRQQLLLTRDITQLERLETMRRDFVANVSHELKTPLTVVSGFVEMISDNYGHISGQDIQRYLGLIREQSARMQRLIEDLLTLSALETGSVQHDEPVDVPPLLATLQAEAEALSNKRHSISLDDGGPAVLLGCANELRSALGNLISNAIRYTPAGGSIGICWRHDSELGGGVFSVRDTGIGVAPQHLPRLTERFYRVDRSRSRETGGTGLGLAIVKHVLTRHQANLTINSEPGKGSCFSAHFPAKRVR